MWEVLMVLASLWFALSIAFGVIAFDIDNYRAAKRGTPIVYENKWPTEWAIKAIIWGAAFFLLAQTFGPNALATATLTLFGLGFGYVPARFLPRLWVSVDIWHPRLKWLHR